MPSPSFCFQWVLICCEVVHDASERPPDHSIPPLFSSFCCFCTSDTVISRDFFIHSQFMPACLALIANESLFQESAKRERTKQRSVGHSSLANVCMLKLVSLCMVRANFVLFHRCVHLLLERENSGWFRRQR